MSQMNYDLKLQSRSGAPRLPCMGDNRGPACPLTYSLKDLLELHSPLLHKANTTSHIIIAMLLTSNYEK